MPRTKQRTSQTRGRRSSRTPAPASASIPRPRTHAFTGCLTCRERHVKCDLSQPACNNCTRLDILCEGYHRKYSWIPARFPDKAPRRSTDPEPVDSLNNGDGQTSRRVLFSEEDRAAMVIQMRDECCVNASHLDLDQVLRDLQNRVFETDEFTRIGPFGIMPIARTGTCDSNPVHSRGDSGADTVGREHRQSAEEFDEKLLDLNWGQMESFPAWETTIANPEANVEDSFFSHQTPIPSPQNSPEQIFQVDWTQQHLHVSSPDISDLLDLPANTQDILPSSNAGYKPTILTMSNDANLRKIPTEARLLLDYYSCRIIDVMSMSPGTKPPWKTIHLPCAMSALAELMVHGETKSFAKMSLFYALLSVSSYHMGSSGKQSKSVSQYWQERGALHKHNAETFLRAALAKDLPKSSRGKYKEILMSFLSMVTIGVFSGNMQDAHSYLAESETLIRTHGLPKPIKSQKVSKLHHIFSFLKIIEESTSLGRRGDRSYSNGHTNDEQNQTEISSSENALVPSTNTRHSESSRLDWVQDEEPEDPDSLFISIYQMPTTLLSLVSQTTSLCKQLHLPSSSTTEFKRKCQIIEDRIFKWKAPECLAVTYPCDATSVDDSVALPNASTIAAHLVTAMHHALIVHFQRQVRNTDPRVLQHYVINVADHLLAHEQLKQSLQIPTAPFPWPGFVAGCEAYDPVAREKVALYMDCVRSYTVGNLMATEKVIREVWRRQDLGRSDKRWENVLSDWGMHIVLT